MNFFQRSKRLKNANYLDLTPIRLEKEEIDSENLVTILIPKFKNNFAKKYIVPRLKSNLIKLKLDELGSESWLTIDGMKKVGEIAKELSLKLGEKIHPAEERLTKFLTVLYEQRLITFNEIKGE